MRVAIFMLAGTTALSGCFSDRIPNSAAHVQPQVQAQQPAQTQAQQTVRTVPLYTPGVEQPAPMTAAAKQIRDAELQGNVMRAPEVVVTQPLAGQPGNGSMVGKTYPSDTATARAEDPATDVASATLSALGKSTPQSASVATQQVSGTSGVANSQAVTTTAQSAAQAQAIATQPLPSRSGSGPNIVQYAITTTNPVGQRMYDRGTNANAGQLSQKCGRFASPDRAQQAFLAAGGPASDKHGLDPDGDGFACSWDPRPFRRAVRG